MRMLRTILVFVLACSRSGSTVPDVSVRMDFTRPDFWAAPFPSDDIRGADGAIALGRFPNPNGIPMVTQAISLLSRDAHGFSLAGGIFFSLTGAIDPSRLPATLEASIAPDAT